MLTAAFGSRLRTVARFGGVLLVIALLAGCMLPPEPRTEAGRDVFNLYLLVLGLAAIVFIGVEGFILYAVFRYRRKPGDDVLPEQLHGNTMIEIIWTAIPTVIVFILFGFSMITLGTVEARDETPGTTIEVEGFQWQWTFRYENGATTTGQANEPPELAVPVGESVRLLLTSNDVNHAFYVPDFLIKRDLIDFGDDREPNNLEFTVTEAGTYSGHCAEFCGEQHAAMLFTVNAMPRAEFDALYRSEARAVSRHPPPGTAARRSRSRPSSHCASTPTPSRRRRVRSSASSSRTTTRRRTTSASRRSTSTGTTFSPASRSPTSSRPWRPATSPSIAPSIRR